MTDDTGCWMLGGGWRRLWLRPRPGQDPPERRRLQFFLSFFGIIWILDSQVYRGGVHGVAELLVNAGGYTGIYREMVGLVRASSCLFGHHTLTLLTLLALLALSSTVHHV
jgi:hypothetical protein